MQHEMWYDHDLNCILLSHRLFLISFLLSIFLFSFIWVLRKGWERILSKILVMWESLTLGDDDSSPDDDLQSDTTCCNAWLSIHSLDFFTETNVSLSLPFSFGFFLLLSRQTSSIAIIIILLFSSSPPQTPSYTWISIHWWSPWRLLWLWYSNLTTHSFSTLVSRHFPIIILLMIRRKVMFKNNMLSLSPFLYPLSIRSYPNVDYYLRLPSSTLLNIKKLVNLRFFKHDAVQY